MSMQNFAAKCIVETTCDETGNECQLRISCQFKDSAGQVHTLARDVNLAPLIQAVQARLAPYYVEQGNVSIEGLGSLYKRATRTATGIAKSKAVKSLYKQAKRIDLEKLKQVAAVIPPPYGPAAAGAIQGMQTAKKIYAVVQSARKGDPKAIQQIATIRAAADNGDEKAISTLTTAQTILNQLKEKEAKTSPTVSGYYGRGC
jgi:hypothetical protein